MISNLPKLPNYIPEDVREELRLLLHILNNNDLPIGMIWVFGSYARGDFISRHDIKADGSVTVYKSDLDLLIVFTKHKVGNQHNRCRSLEKQIRKNSNISTSIHFHFISSDKLNRHLKNGHYLYSDIVKEGIRLLDTGEIELASPDDLTPSQKQGIGNREFELNFESALGFQSGFEFYFLEGNYAMAIFHLHQVAEQIYRTLIFVFINYRHRTHDLKELEEEAAKLCPSIRGVIPKETVEESKRFTLLQKSYIGARYAAEFNVNKEALLVIACNVAELQRVAFQACTERIKSYCPARKYSAYKPSRTFLDIEALTQKKPTQEQIEQLKKGMEKADADRENERQKREAAELREKEALRQVEVERNEKERLEALLKKAGIDPKQSTI